MVRTAARLRGEGVHVAILDLTAIGQNLSPEQWYGGLLRRLGMQLDHSGDLEDELDNFWLEHTRQQAPGQRRSFPAFAGVSSDGSVSSAPREQGPQSVVTEAATPNSPPRSAPLQTEPRRP